MLKHTDSEPGAWQRFVNALIERCEDVVEELGHEEMLIEEELGREEEELGPEETPLERQDFDQGLERAAGKTEDSSRVQNSRS